MKKPTEEKKRYTVGEVSKLCNISKKALRFYDQIGVLSPDEISAENGYRYYSHETLLLVPVVKYYKQMGFKLEEMQGLVKGNSYYYLEKNFRNKIDELKIKEQQIHNCYIAVKDWYELLKEAQMVRENCVNEVSIKYLPEDFICYQEQEFDYNYMETIINVAWVNYLESVSNEITGPVILYYPSYKDKMNRTSKTVRILQKAVLPCAPEMKHMKFGGGMVVSVYHIGSLETLDEEYKKIEEWVSGKGYQCGAECFERHVVDYWTTRNKDEFVTEIIVPVEKKHST